MIDKIVLKNYRNLVTDGGLNFDSLTIFVGPNGSGKTNLIRVLQFIRDAWINEEDERRGVSRFEIAVARWGSGRILDRSIKTPAIVSIDLRFKIHFGYRHRFTLQLDVSAENRVSVRHEVLSRWSQDENSEFAFRFYDANIANKDIMVHLDLLRELKIDKAKEYILHSLPANELAVHSLQEWLEQNSNVPAKEVPFFEGKRLITNNLRSWEFYDSGQINVDAIKKASVETGLGDQSLTPAGDNLALVLFNLSRDIDFAEKIQQAMTELFPDTRSLRATVVGRHSLTVEWYLNGIPKPFFLDEMSEGTIRMLCWAAILFSPIKSRLLVLDEPEACLHPAWLRVLAGWIREASRENQVVVSTHSPDLLDYFTEEIESVRVFDRDPDNPLYTRIKPLTKTTAADKVADGWRLGDLYRVGDPQIGGWPW